MSMPSSRASEAPFTERLGDIDALRGVGLLFMVIDHAYDWWLVEAENTGAWGRATEFIGTLAAPIFLALVGVSMALASARYRAQGLSARRAAWLLARRGLIVCLWGYAVNLLVFFDGRNWADLVAFDVLQCIGIGMALLAPCVVWGPAWLASLLALALGVGGQFADRIAFPGYLGTMVNGNPPISYFPLLPWLGFVPLGILWGRALVRWRADRAASNRLALVLVGAGLLALAGAVVCPPHVGYRHPRLISMLFDLAVVAWAGAALYGFHRLAWGRRALGWLRCLGRETLFLYVLHHLIGFRFFYLLGWATGRSWRGQYGVFGAPQATLALITLGIGLYLAARVWSRWKAGSGAGPRLARWVL